MAVTKLTSRRIDWVKSVFTQKTSALMKCTYAKNLLGPGRIPVLKPSIIGVFHLLFQIVIFFLFYESAKIANSQKNANLQTQDSYLTTILLAPILESFFIAGFLRYVRPAKNDCVNLIILAIVAAALHYPYFFPKTLGIGIGFFALALQYLAWSETYNDRWIALTSIAWTHFIYNIFLIILSKI